MFNYLLEKTVQFEFYLLIKLLLTAQCMLTFYTIFDYTLCIQIYNKKRSPK